MGTQCLGFDTSNYTTSAAVFGGGTAENRGRLLTVPQGALGLRQSDALFQHVKRLHQMVEELRAAGALGELSAVGASTRPREGEGLCGVMGGCLSPRTRWGISSSAPWKTLRSCLAAQRISGGSSITAW